MTAKKDEPAKIDPAIASDVDGDGKLDLNPEATEVTLLDLVTLDHALRDHGSSVADLLRHVASAAQGIKL